MADVFAGVGTTALALEADARVQRVLAVEYSPFAHWVSATKLLWPSIDPDLVKAAVDKALAEKLPRDVGAPALSSFSNPRVIEPSTAIALSALRGRIDTSTTDPATRAFLRLGLAAVIEPLSNVIKDGRALRVIASGHHKRAVIQSHNDPTPTGDAVLDAVARQWQAMIEDVELLAAKKAHVRAEVLSTCGDARYLAGAIAPGGQQVFGDNEVGLCVASPPYLNFIDYTEVYKLELWLLEFVRNQQEFRDLRLGTLRSHPSIQFPDRPTVDLLAATPAMQVVRAIGLFLSANHARPAVARAVVGYFEDMVQVLREQFRILEPGGHSVLVVGNSTFSRRQTVGDVRKEEWRMPVLTDVLLARLGEAVGFVDVAVWSARDLRPRNVRSGSARESLVVLRKPE